jgi:hypothetical protein
MQTFLTRSFAALVLAAATASSHAADLKLEAKLLWGTNDDKCDGTCKTMDKDLASKLHGMFKWQNYYEITNQTTAIPLNQSRNLKMSGHCTLQIKNVGGSRIEINCIGDGKQVCKSASTLVPPKWLVLAGNDTNDTAWFIALRSVDSKAADARKNLTNN